MRKRIAKKVEQSLLDSDAGMTEVRADFKRISEQLAGLGNMTYEAHYLSKGERALILRALKHLVHDQQQMISKAYEKYKKKDPAIFADHKKHHQQQIAACDALHDRLRGDGWKAAPTNSIKKG